MARYVTPRNARDLFDEGDVIFCAVDNHRTRRTVARAAARLRDSVLISGGNDGIGEGRAGTFGSVLLQVRRDGVNITNPIWRFHPEIASPSDRRPDELGCGELVESVPQLVFTNLAVAAAMCGAFYGWLVRDAPAYEELCLDILAGRSVPLLRLVRRESAAK